MNQQARMADGFCYRGSEVTRLEAFLDASFAFALSLLAIAGNEIPRSVEDLLGSLKAIPAFAASFLLLIQFWRAHANWSRRYGLDDERSQYLSLLLIFLVLIFVYPMHMVFSSMFAVLTGGVLPQQFEIDSSLSVRALFITFGVAFFSMGLVMALLYRNALRFSALLALDHFELKMTRLIVWQWLMIPIVAAISVLLAVFLPDSLGNSLWMGVPGFIYFSLNFASFWFAWRLRKIRQAIARDAI